MSRTNRRGAICALILCLSLSLSACEQGGGSAVSCVVTQNCPIGSHCHEASGLCLPNDGCQHCDAATQDCVGGVCKTRCRTTADCPLQFYCDTASGHCETAGADPDLAEPEPEPEPEPAPEEELHQDPCGDTCTGDQLCYAWKGGQTYGCRDRCDPFAVAPCPEGRVCHITLDPVVGGVLDGLCREADDQAAQAGEACDNETRCRPELVCIDRTCREVCDPNGDPLCGDGKPCNSRRIPGLGLCMDNPSCPTLPCQQGFVCQNGRCVQGQGCAADFDCAAGVCEAGVCVESCLTLGCPNHKPVCDTATGRCGAPSICGGGCPAGYYCDGGRCVTQCDPPCEGREYCTNSECRDPPDCRDGEVTCLPGQLCDQRTGYCVKQCPPTCFPPTCCDASTDYMCGECQSEVCSALNPTGPCPLFDQRCVGGLCKTDTTICVPDGYACNAASRCCSADAAASVSCCIGTTELTGACCPANTTCIYVGSICLPQF